MENNDRAGPKPPSPPVIACHGTKWQFSDTKSGKITAISAPEVTDRTAGLLFNIYTRTIHVFNYFYISLIESNLSLLDYAVISDTKKRKNRDGLPPMPSPTRHQGITQSRNPSNFPKNNCGIIRTVHQFRPPSKSGGSRGKRNDGRKIWPNTRQISDSGWR